MAFVLKFDRDALVKALTMAAFAGALAALAVLQTAIPGLQLDPTIQGIALLVVATIIAAISKAQPTTEAK